MTKKIIIFLLFLTSFIITSFVFADNSDQTALPKLIVNNINIDQATMIINATIENYGADMKSNLSYTITAEDLDTGMEYRGIITDLKSGETETVLLDNKLILNNTNHVLSTNASGKYNLRVTADNYMDKTIYLNNTDENSLRIENIKVDNRSTETGNVTISWETNMESTGEVQILLGQNYKSTKLQKKHSVTIDNLSRNTFYFYTIKAEAGSLSSETTQKKLTSGGDKSFLSDLTITDAYLYKEDLSDQNIFNGYLAVLVKNIGQGYAGNHIVVYIDISGSWFNAKYNQDISELVNNQKIVEIPIKSNDFNGSPLKVNVWVDSDPMVDKNFVVKYDNLSVVELNEDNNTFSGYIKYDPVLQDIYYASNAIVGEKYDDLRAKLGQKRNTDEEYKSWFKLLTPLEGFNNLTQKEKNSLSFFTTYGVDQNTKFLGAGERAAVVYSYKTAYGKIPKLQTDYSDLIRIANGRWPNETSIIAEKKAEEHFKKIYKKISDMENPQDNAAITIMAYGLKQKAENRNLASEKKGIENFKNIYGYNPKTTEDWNIMQAITYSGASRSLDSDGDYLIDSREIILGTDLNNKDTDGDGYIDGIEVKNGYDPLA